MSRRLAVYVHVQDNLGDTHAFGPDDRVPKWAVDKITNPDVWAKDEPEADPVAAMVTSQPADVPPGTVKAPGKNAKRDAWVEYAAHHQVPIGDGYTVKQIIQAIDDAGAPTA